VAAYLVTFLLFFLQFAYFPIGVSYFESPKIYLTEIIVFLLLITEIFLSKFSKYIFNKKVIISFTVLILLTIIDLVFFAKPTTFFGNSFRLQGVFLLWILILFSFLSANIPLPRLPIYLLTGILILQFLAVLFISGGISERAVGTIGEPNALAAVVLFIWPFIWYTKQKSSYVFKIISLIITALIIFLSGSRSGMIAFIIQFVFIVSTARFYIPAKYVVIFCFILLLLSWALPFADQTNPYERRSDIWNIALNAGLEKPVIGYGFGNTEYAIHDVSVQDGNKLGKSYVDSSHNIFLDWFVQGGIVGLGIFLFLLFRSMMVFIYRQDARSIVLLLGLISALSFNPASIVSLIALWWLIGQGTLKTYVKKRTKGQISQ
jgi:O-antigen ligase